MFSSSQLFADLSGGKLEFRGNGIEQRRLSHTGIAGHHADLSVQQLCHIVDGLRLVIIHQIHRDAGISVQRFQLFALSRSTFVRITAGWISWYIATVRNESNSSRFGVG